MTSRPDTSPATLAASARVLDRDGFNRLVAASRRNTDVFDRLKYLDHSARTDATQAQVVITDQRNTIIAAASLQQSPYDQKRLWLLGISVDAQHRNQGHATALLRSAFAHAAARAQTLEVSSFSDDGRSYLAPLIPRLHREFPALTLSTSRYPATVFDGAQPYTLSGDGKYQPAAFK